jgi:saccharopine dehydrogenase (NAD+, L-lysine-forming)
VAVAVLGAAGTISPAVIRDLAESDEVAALTLLDRDGDGVRRAAAEHGAGRAEAREVDAQQGLAAALDGADVLVNAASYRVNLDAMRASLEAGCHYIDFGGLYRVTDEQLRLNGEFESAGLLALLGMGSSPGKTNVMAARAVNELGVRPERVDVMAAGRDLEPPQGGLSVPYALQTLVDELTIEPVVLREGRPVEIEPLSPGGEVDFGEPIGRGDTIFTLHSEMRTFAESFGASEGSFRLSLSPALLERLRALSDAGQDEIAAAAAAALPPSAHTVSVHVVEASAGPRTIRVRAITRPLERWGLGGGIVSTGAPAAAAVRLLARGRIAARGALPPERCIDPGDLFAELEQRGTTFEVEARESSPQGVSS